MELGERGVRVNCICPGGIATPIFGKSFGLSPDQAETTIPLMKGVLEKLQPIRRPGLVGREDRKSTRLNSSHITISYAVFCLKKKNDIGILTSHSNACIL